MSVSLALAFVGGIAGGAIARFYRIPGGILLGSVLGAAAVQLALGGEESLSVAVRVSVQIAIGAVIGASLKLDSLSGLKQVVLFTPPLLILMFGVAGFSGILLAAVLGVSVITGLLATIPGGASDIIAIALDIGDGASIVAAVHLLRLLIIYGVLTTFFRKAFPPAPVDEITPQV